MKYAQQLITVLFLALLAWSCEKEAKFNTITGTLSPGQDMSRENLDSVPVVMVKIWDTLDFASVTLEPRNFEHHFSAVPDAGGYFHFDSLPDGNYLVAAGEGFTFADVDYVKVSASDGSVNQVNKTVNRVPLKNGPEIYSVDFSNYTRFDITRLEFFVNDLSRWTVDVPLNSNPIECYYCLQQGSCDILLDPDVNPYFQLTLDDNMGTAVQTPWMPFFHSIFVCYELTLFTYSRWVDGQEELTDLIFKKSWFFGHIIAISRVKHGNPGW
jgi:hypothetical protein